MPRRPALLVLAALGLVLPGGCGSSSSATSTPAAATTAAAAPAAPPQSTPSPQSPSAPAVPKELLPPAGVPRRPDGRPADAVSARVIRKWLSALRAGDIARAARFFALPAKVQNATPVITLRSAADREAFNDSFPCGARATRLEHGSGGYTIVEFVLTERVDGDCMGAAGGTARSAIRVVRGHITDWYRLDELRPRGPATLGGGGTVA